MTLLARTVLGIFILLAIALATVAVLNERSLGESYAELEQESAVRELRRLVKTFDNEADSLQQLLLGWAHSNGLYAYVANRDPNYLRANLNAPVLAAADVSWAMLLDTDGRVTDLVAISELGEVSSLRQSLTPYMPQLTQSVSGSAAQCGIVVLNEDEFITCRMPIVDAAASQPPNGMLILARRFDDRLLIRVEDNSQLLFQIGVATAENTQTMAVPAVASRIFGRSLPQLQTEYDRVVLSLPLRDLHGEPFAYLQLSTDRTITERGDAAIHQTQIRLLIFSIAFLAALVIAIDRLLLMRIQRIQRDLGEIHRDRDWQRRLDMPLGDLCNDLARPINQLLEVLDSQKQNLAQFSMTDPVTGVASQRAFRTRLELAIRHYRRNHTPLSLLQIEVDALKEFRTTHGPHLAEAAIKQVARTLLRTVNRAGDLCARYGHHGFAVLLENSQLEAATHIAEQIHSGVLSLSIPHMGRQSGLLTVSIGIGAYTGSETPDDFCARVEQAERMAELEGGNRIQVAAHAR